MRPTIRTAALAACIVLGATSIAAPAAWAQAAPPAPAHGPKGDGQRGDMRARMEAMRQAHEQQRAQDLKTVLRLRPDQEPALTAFLASHKRPDHSPGGPGGPGGPEGRRGPPGGAPPAAMTTTQRLDMDDKRMAEMSTRRQQHEAALRTFYAALNPEQRQVFDALQRMQHGHGGFRGGPGGGFGHGRMHGPPPGFRPGFGDDE
jgi:Spy/CpxP family protein refolding chaperone